MSKKSIRKSIDHYKGLRTKAEEELKKLEEELELLNIFRKQYINAQTEFGRNMNNRNKRLSQVGDISAKVKCAEKYHKGMYETLNGNENKVILMEIESISDNTNKEIHEREVKIEDLKRDIDRYNRTIRDLYDQLSRERD